MGVSRVLRIYPCVDFHCKFDKIFLHLGIDLYRKKGCYLSKVIHFPVAQKNEISKSISADIVKEAHAPVAGENVVQFGVQRPKSIRERSTWRSRYGGLSIEINPYAFDSEEEYLSFIDELGALLCAYDQA